MYSATFRWAIVPLLLAGLLPFASSTNAGGIKDLGYDWQLPREKLMLPFAKRQPITFVSTKNLAEWKSLPNFWNPVKETVTHPSTGEKVERSAVKIKLLLGLTQVPKIPADNPMTVAAWELGRDLYFDTILSTDGTVACATCHEPRKGFTDQSAVSTGINNKKGGVSAPTVMNSAYNFLQFWDGRASSLEDQAQGPVQNSLEMFAGKGDAHWPEAIQRVRKKGDYVKRFHLAYGTDPTRDVVAKAIAVYERTVLNGNSIHDRADLAMRLRVADEEGTDFTIKAKDYAKVLEEAFAKNDATALKALNLDPAKDQGKVKLLAEQINVGRTLFFGKARCSLCHVGENFSDGQFHNLGVGVTDDGQIPAGSLGRFAALPTGAKDPEMVGAFKTPTLRGLVSTAPYLHDGHEKTLEQVVDFYDKGGRANEYLSPKMRDLDAEKAYLLSKAAGTPYKGPEVKLFGPDQKPIVPSKLNLTTPEKAALVLFLRALEGEVPALVMDPKMTIPGQ